MYTNLLWTSKEYHSSENCIVRTSDAGYEVHSVIVGSTGAKPFKADYLIKTNANWETLYCQLSLDMDGNNTSILLQKEEDGCWMQNDVEMSEFNGCSAVDIPLTPFTNTLAINRFQLHPNESELIRVVYLDILHNSVRAVQQKYTKVSHNKYHYENVPNDFEAIITVDDMGLVISYPTLFERVAVSKWG